MCRQRQLSLASTTRACASGEVPITPAAPAGAALLSPCWGRCGALPGALLPLVRLAPPRADSPAFTLFIMSVHGCSTTKSQCLSPSRPNHKICPRSSKSGCRQYYPSCRLVPLAVWWAIWVEFEEPHLSLLNCPPFFILKNSKTPNPDSLASCKVRSTCAGAVLAGGAGRQLAVALEGVCSSVYQMSVNSAAFC